MKVRPYQPENGFVTISKKVLEQGKRVSELSDLNLDGYYGHILVTEVDADEDNAGVLIWIPATLPEDIGVE